MTDRELLEELLDYALDRSQPYTLSDEYRVKVECLYQEAKTAVLERMKGAANNPVETRT